MTDALIFDGLTGIPIKDAAAASASAWPLACGFLN